MVYPIRQLEHKSWLFDLKTNQGHCHCNCDIGGA